MAKHNWGGQRSSNSESDQQRPPEDGQLPLFPRCWEHRSQTLTNYKSLCCSVTKHRCQSSPKNLLLKCSMRPSLLITHCLVGHIIRCRLHHWFRF